ncbi:phosphotransferase family protein [Catellatospora sp. NPDC049609]|uniref:phosphotransferase family protein n=1 Tax=Catellatospora sp. NPDC049609 TaxID=3155505 RepID=UPI00341E8BCA
MTDPKGLDLGALRSFLDRARPGLVTGELTGELIQGGKSNLTYRVGDGARRWVVRRPPLGHVLSTAHDMSREYRVISALGGTRVPVPGTVALCEDPDVIGAPFYVMEHVDGTVWRTAQQASTLGAPRVGSLSLALMDVLADLHSVDPAAVGLADFGKPEGYLARQLRRWSTQLQHSHNRELPGLQELHDDLVARMPAQAAQVSILHGDYRLDNCIVGPGDQIAAVLDWEMATIGDPLADLGLFLCYWRMWTEPVMEGLFGEPAAPGIFPLGAQMAERYAARRGTDLSALPWYVAFAHFKLVGILEGVHYRYLAGQTVGEGFDRVGAMVPHLITLGRKTLQEA